MNLFAAWAADSYCWAGAYGIINGMVFPTWIILTVVVSGLFGLALVIAVAWLLFSYISRRRDDGRPPGFP